MAASDIWSATPKSRESTERAREGFEMGLRGPQGLVEGWYVLMCLDASALMASNASPAYQPTSHCTCRLSAVNELKHPPIVETLLSPRRD